MNYRLPRRDVRGLDFVRACMCVAVAGGNELVAQRVAQRHFGEQSEVLAFLQKGAVPAAYTGDSGGWAEDLSEPIVREFIGILDEVSVFGQVGPRPAPMDCRLNSATSGATGFWVGEARPAPVTSMAFDHAELKPRAVAAIAVLSKQLLKLGDRRAEEWIRGELIRACVSTLDQAFLDPENSGSGDVKPASILNGITPIDASDIADDSEIEWLLKKLVADHEGDLTNAAWIAKPETFVALNSFTRPLCGMDGGSLLGARCIASRNVPDGEDGAILALVDGSSIAAGDTGLDVSTSDQSSVEMLDSSLVQDPTAGTGAQQVSMFQTGLIGLRVSRGVNWAALRPAVTWATNITIADTSA